MRKTCLVILGLLLFGVNQLSSPGFNRAQATSPAAGLNSDDLVFVGTVTKVYPVAAPRQRKRWAVVTHVERVVSGEFSDSTFTFTIHSPANAGLRLNRAYLIRAIKTDGRYSVNESTLEEVRPRKKSSGKD